MRDSLANDAPPAPLDAVRLMVASRDSCKVFSREAAMDAAREGNCDCPPTEGGAPPPPLKDFVDALERCRVGLSSDEVLALAAFGRGFVMPSRTHLARMAMSGSGTWWVVEEKMRKWVVVMMCRMGDSVGGCVCVCVRGGGGGKFSEVMCVCVRAWGNPGKQTQSYACVRVRGGAERNAPEAELLPMAKGR
jgi:hypothetical protein